MLAVIALAISGLTLAWTIYWSVSQRRLATRPRLNVRSVWATVTFGPAAGQPCIQTTATNVGLAPVTVDSSSMLIRGQRGKRVAIIQWVAETPGPLPIHLEPGGHWTGIAHAPSIKQSIDRFVGPRDQWQVRPLVGDPTGHAHKAKPVAVGWRRLLRRRWMKLPP